MWGIVFQGWSKIPHNYYKYKNIEGRKPVDYSALIYNMDIMIPLEHGTGIRW